VMASKVRGGKALRRMLFAAGMTVMMLVGIAVIVNAQGPPPPGPFGDAGPGMGGPMAGIFEFGGLMGGFAGKVVTGKPILAAITITHTETLPGNTISNTTTGTLARGADGSTYRDVKLSAIGPWAASGKAHEIAYIRNVTKGTQYIVNVTKGTYRAFPIRERKPPQGEKKDSPDRPDTNNETVTDNPNGTYTDPVTNTVYPVDDRKVTRTIPAGAIGNQFALVITFERWYSTAMDLLLEDTHTDPRFGTTTYQLTSIGHTPASSLFTPDSSFTQVQGGGFGRGRNHGEGMQPPPPLQN
jgi:hypothetical protein